MGSRRTDRIWEAVAKAKLVELGPEIRSILTFWGIKEMEVRIGGTPDIASIPNAHPPVLIIGRKWVEAPDDRERLKRVLHEVAGHMALGMEHGPKSRQLGYYSDPERDLLSWAWWDDWQGWRLGRE